MVMFILALDDIVAIILNDIAIDCVSLHYGGHTFDITAIFVPVIIDVVMSVILGFFAGYIISKFLNREHEFAEYINLVIGSVLILIGIAIMLNISYILPTMVFGITVASLCKRPFFDIKKRKTYHETVNKKTRAVEVMFNEIYRIVSPIVVIFFVLIGLSLDISLILQIGLIGILYMITRTTAKYFGSILGSFVSKSPTVVQKYLGACLLSQAGVALGLAVIMEEHFASFGAAETGTFILNTIVASTIVFQIFGPIAIKWAIDKSGEATSSYV
jgi:NhaP-type Na+/H+ or K+/H+ antiporter